MSTRIAPDDIAAEFVDSIDWSHTTDAPEQEIEQDVEDEAQGRSWFGYACTWSGKLPPHLEDDLPLSAQLRHEEIEEGRRGS